MVKKKSEVDRYPETYVLPGQRWEKMTLPRKCWICGKVWKPTDRTSACGGKSYCSKHDDEEATKQIPKTWAYFREHGEDKPKKDKAYLKRTNHPEAYYDAGRIGDLLKTYSKERLAEMVVELQETKCQACGLIAEAYGACKLGEFVCPVKSGVWKVCKIGPQKPSHMPCGKKKCPLPPDDFEPDCSICGRNPEVANADVAKEILDLRQKNTELQAYNEELEKENANIRIERHWADYQNKILDLEARLKRCSGWCLSMCEQYHRPHCHDCPFVKVMKVVSKPPCDHNFNPLCTPDWDVVNKEWVTQDRCSKCGEYTFRRTKPEKESKVKFPRLKRRPKVKLLDEEGPEGDDKLEKVK